VLTAMGSEDPTTKLAAETPPVPAAPTPAIQAPVPGPAPGT
jgi:hypothetical protein